MKLVVDTPGKVHSKLDQGAKGGVPPIMRIMRD